MNQIFPLESQPLDPKRAKGDHEKDKFLSWWSGFSCWIREGQDLIKKRTSFWHDDLDFRVGSEKDKIRGGSVLVPGTRSRGVGASFRGVAFRNVFWARPPSSRLLLVNLDKHRPYNVWGVLAPFQPYGLYHLSPGVCISKLNKRLYELEHLPCSWFLGLVKRLRPCVWPPQASLPETNNAAAF